MIQLLLTLVAVLLSASAAVAQVERFVSPAGSGTTYTSGSPGAMRDGIRASSASDIVTAAAGTYTGDLGMIWPTSGQSGTSGSPITVRCPTETCTVDGDFSRIPINLNANDWWVIEGFDVHSGTHSVIYNNTGSDNNVFRRIVAWDAAIDTNGAVIASHGLTNALFEDVAAFGAGRKIFSNSQAGNAVTCRRCWFRWEGSTFGASLGVTLFYKAYNAIYENVLVTWSGESMPETYTVANPNTPGINKTNFEPYGPGALLTNDRLEDATVPKNANAEVRGAIVYTKATDRLPTTVVGGGGFTATPGIWHFGASSLTLTDVVRVMSPSHSRFNLHLGIALTRRPFNGPVATSNDTDAVVSDTATRITSIRGTAGDQFHADWTVTPTSVGTSLAAVITPWQNDQAAARVCYRWGTTTPLWPWPMNDRILAATTAAGAYAGPCTTNCVGGRVARTATNVTTDIEALLGTIPTACRELDVQEFPDATGFPAQPVLSTFSGSATPPTGFATVAGNSFAEGSGVATPVLNFSTIRWNTPLGPNQEAYATISALPTEGGVSACLNFRIEDSSNRYTICLARVVGANNDTATLFRRVAGTPTTLAGPVNLGVDLAVNDAVGVKVVSNAITGTYNAGAWAEWREILTGTATSTPASSYIGYGAELPSTITSFGGGGDAVGGDTEAPSTPANCTATIQSQTQLMLTCDASTDNVSVVTYHDEQCDGAACSDWAEIRATNALAYLSNGLTENTLYRHRRRAFDGTNFGSYSSIFEGTPGAIPSGGKRGGSFLLGVGG